MPDKAKKRTWLYHPNQRRGRIFEVDADDIAQAKKEGWVESPADLPEPAEPEGHEDARKPLDVDAAIARFKAPREKLKVREQMQLADALGIEGRDDMDAAELKKALADAIKARDKADG